MHFCRVFQNSAQLSSRLGSEQVCCEFSPEKGEQAIGAFIFNFDLILVKLSKMRYKLAVVRPWPTGKIHLTKMLHFM